MDPSNKKHRPESRPPSSRDIRRSIEMLGLPDFVTDRIYEYTVFIPKTIEELREMVLEYCKDPSRFPPINSWDVSNITNFHGVFAIASINPLLVGTCRKSKTWNQCFISAHALTTAWQTGMFQVSPT